MRSMSPGEGRQSGLSARGAALVAGDAGEDWVSMYPLNKYGFREASICGPFRTHMSDVPNAPGVNTFPVGTREVPPGVHANSYQ